MNWGELKEIFSFGISLIPNLILIFLVLAALAYWFLVYNQLREYEVREKKKPMWIVIIVLGIILMSAIVYGIILKIFFLK